MQQHSLYAKSQVINFETFIIFLICFLFIKMVFKDSKNFFWYFLNNLFPDLKVDQSDNGICTDITASRGVIQSPNYPRSSGFRRLIIYSIEGPTNGRIQLTFSTIVLFSNRDFIYVGCNKYFFPFFSLLNYFYLILYR